VVDVEELERVDRVLSGGPAVRARGLKAGVAEQLGDDDEVGAPANEPRREGVAQDMRGDVVVLQAGGRGDRCDDVVRALDRQPAAALVEKQRRGIRAGPVGAFVKPAGEAGAQVGGWIGISRTFSPLPRIRRTPLRADSRTSSTSRPTISAIRVPA
jgi:hypothetical protein